MTGKKDFEMENKEASLVFGLGKNFLLEMSSLITLSKEVEFEFR